MPSARPALVASKAQARSRITNGRELVPGIDGRSCWARRMRDLMNLHAADRGGLDAISEAERSIVRRIATLTVELERLELQFAQAEGATPDAIDLYQRTANSLRRLLESVGIKRVPKDVTPHPLDYAKSNGRAKAAAQ